jgi:hypothetical protein
MSQNVVIGSRVVFSYPINGCDVVAEERSGLVEKISKDGTAITLQDAARGGQYRSFRFGKMGNLRVIGHGPLVA